MPERRTLEKAIFMLQETFKKAVKNPTVRKPVAYSLYKIWRYMDTHEKEACHEQGNGHQGA